MNMLPKHIAIKLALILFLALICISVLNRAQNIGAGPSDQFSIYFKPVTEGLNNMLFSDQADWLKQKYGMTVVRKFFAISMERGGGVFIAEKYGLDKEKRQQLLEALRSDNMIELGQLPAT